MSHGDGVDVDISVLGPRNIMAQQVSLFWTQWDSARVGIIDAWSEVLRYTYATSTKGTTNEAVADWSNTTHRPKMANLYDTLSINYDSALFPNDDWLYWQGNDTEASSKEKRTIVQAYMKTKHGIRASGFRQTMRLLESDWILFGNAFAEVEYVRDQSVDPLTGQATAGYIGPKVKRRDPRDICFNPLAGSFKSAPKITRDMYTMADLNRLVEDNPGNEMWKKTLDIALKHRGSGYQSNLSDFDRDTQMSIDGFGTASQYLNSGLVEVLNFYGDMWVEGPNGGEYLRDRVISVVDRWEVSRDEIIDTWTGKPHIYHVPWRERTENLWGQGPFENLVGMQYRIDHLENARADAFDQMLDPDIVFRGDVEDIMQIGGAKHYYIAENGNIDYLRPDTTVLNADLQIRELTDSMELYALSPRESLGFRTPGEKTLGEVQSLNNAAARSFQHKVNIFQEFLEEVVNGELEVTVRQMDGFDVIEVVDDDFGASEFKKITKADITSNGKLVPIGARHFARNTQLVQNLQALQQGPLADPEVAQHFSSLGLAELYQEWMDLGGENKEVVAPYARIEERLESQRRMQAAQDQALQESAVDTGVDVGPNDQAAPEGLPVGETPPG
jgi:hypothetical protein